MESRNFYRKPVTSGKPDLCLPPPPIFLWDWFKVTLYYSTNPWGEDGSIILTSECNHFAIGSYGRSSR